MSKNVEEIILKLRDQYNKTIGKALKNTEKLRKQTGGLNKSIGKLEKRAKQAFIAFASVQAIKGIAKLGIEMEQTRVAFSTFLGDADKANKTIKELNEFSNVTPFDNAQVLKAGKSLLAFGTPAEKLKSQLKNIGDISSGTGKDFNELATIYGKAQIAGTLYAEDINQLVEAGIPIISEFAKQLGVNESQVKKLASQGKIGFGNLQKAFQDMTGDGGQFFNLMEKQSKTVGGQISTLQGQLQMVGIALGEALLPVIQKIIEKVQILTSWITQNKDRIAAWVPTIVTTVGIITGLIAVIRIWMGVQTAINFLLTANPIGLVIVAIGALIGVISVLWKRTEDLSVGMQRFQFVLKILFWPLNMVIKLVKLLIDNFDTIKHAVATTFDYIKSRAMGLVRILKGVFKVINNPFDGEQRKKGLAQITEGVGNFQESFNDLSNKRKARNAEEAYEAAKAKKDQEVLDASNGSDLDAIMSNRNKSNTNIPTNASLTSGIIPSSPSKTSGSNVNGVSGGKSQKNITINIQKLVENFSINTTTLKQGAAEAEEAMTKVLLTALNNVQIQGE